jgi:hypothetical protein
MNIICQHCNAPPVLVGGKRLPLRIILFLPRHRSADEHHLPALQRSACSAAGWAAQAILQLGMQA